MLEQLPSRVNLSMEIREVPTNSHSTTPPGHNWLGLGGTIVDSMSTLAIMGEIEEFKKAAEWCKTSLHFENKGDVSFFETTIRILGEEWSETL